MWHGLRNCWQTVWGLQVRALCIAKIPSHHDTEVRVLELCACCTPEMCTCSLLTLQSAPGWACPVQAGQIEH